MLDHMIPVYRIYKTKNTLKYLQRVYDDNWYSHGGYFYNYAKDMLASRLGVAHVLLTNNGTTATHLLAKILKNKAPITKIATQNGSYVAAWNAFLFDGDMTIDMVDLEEKTWNVNKERLLQHVSQEDPDDTAILLVHNIGNPIQIQSTKHLVVEDNCEGFLGLYHNGKHTGTNCLASSVSFFANKNITCGEGGAVLTNDTESYEYALAVHGQGQSSKRFVHDKLGYNYRMTNLSAAVLASQLEEVDDIFTKKTELFQQYRDALSSIDEISFQHVEPGAEHSHWMFGMKINGSDYGSAEGFFKSHGVEVRPMFYPASTHRHIGQLMATDKVNIVDGETVSEKLNKEVVIIPSFPDLTSAERSHIISVIKKYVHSISSMGVG